MLHLTPWIGQHTTHPCFFFFFFLYVLFLFFMFFFSFFYVFGGFLDQVDLMRERTLVAVETKCGHPGYFCTQFAMHVSSDGKQFQPVTAAITAVGRASGNTEKDHEGEELKQNSGGLLETTNGCTRVVLAPVVRRARFVRFYPKKFVRHGCMRVELYGF
mmetsp:Transcript_1475/g.2844  ORF Transcript_1475/g.2844 Transcript_1475/m.2844 type:complete len:159 (-) Transcript_1475:130-606(-)